MEDDLKRINKFIGETGFCSRREADQLITEGRVTVNGEVAGMGMKVAPNDEVRVDGKLVREKNEKPVYLAFNKPVGIECTTNLEVRDNIVDYINYPKRLFPIGRLDKASEGLIFMTNDGDIVNKILRARNNHEKEYIVTVNKPITDRFAQRMGNGIPILDTVTRKCLVEKIDKFTFRIILTQGLNRQIRRMCEYLGYEVVTLKRVRIINITLDVPVGRYRDLTDTEITALNQLIAPSSKTEEASFLDESRKLKDSVKLKVENRKSNEGIGSKVESRKSKDSFGSKVERQKSKEPAITPRRSSTSDEKPAANPGHRTTGKFSPQKTAPKIEFIKKDDPRYKNKGDY